tara:strand:+ start:166 stop:642 length:477 start_codon:yes stop_codon:yes gene_type:complete
LGSSLGGGGGGNEGLGACRGVAATAAASSVESDGAGGSEALGDCREAVPDGSGGGRGGDIAVVGSGGGVGREALGPRIVNPGGSGGGSTELTELSPSQDAVIGSGGGLAASGSSSADEATRSMLGCVARILALCSFHSQQNFFLFFSEEGECIALYSV